MQYFFMVKPLAWIILIKRNLNIFLKQKKKTKSSASFVLITWLHKVINWLKKKNRFFNTCHQWKKNFDIGSVNRTAVDTLLKLLNQSVFNFPSQIKKKNLFNTQQTIICNNFVFEMNFFFYFNIENNVHRMRQSY